MNNNTLIGEEGERIATEYLIKKGYTIIERNYRYKHSEIDVIAKLAKLLIFVEVKTKSYTFYGNPEISVTPQKVRAVLQGAEHYIFDKDWTHDIRFDVIALEKKPKGYEVHHFEDAFY